MGYETNYYGCVRVKPETFKKIGKAIEKKGALTKFIVKNNKKSKNSEKVNKAEPGSADAKANYNDWEKQVTTTTN